MPTLKIFKQTASSLALVFAMEASAGTVITIDEDAPATAVVTTLADLPRDRALFGAGNAAGLNEAVVPLEGVSDTEGARIDARAVLASDGVTVVRQTDGIATADGTGAWSGSFGIPKTPYDWCRVEVRAGGGAWTRSPADRRCAAAAVVYKLGQSELNRGATQGFNAGMPKAAIADPDAVQMVINPKWGGEGLELVHCEDGAALMTSAMSHYASEWIADAPGEKVIVAWITRSGTHPDGSLDDDNAERAFSDDDATASLASMAGLTTADLHMWHWNAENRTWRDGFMLQVMRREFGVDLAGAADPVAGNEHLFGDLTGTDWSRTRVCVNDPHRFESDDTQIAEARIAIRRDWDAAGGAGRVLPPSIAPIAYRNAVGDAAHPDHQDLDGLARLWRYLAVMDLHTLGLVAFDLPEFDAAAWTAGGVILSSSVGSITTVRTDRAEAAPDAGTYPWWTPVMAMRINGAFAENTSLASGGVRIDPNSGTFDGASVADFATGAGAGRAAGVTSDESIGAETWKDLPMVDVGLPSGLLIPVLPIPDQADIVSTLSGGVAVAAPYQKSAAGPEFVTGTFGAAKDSFYFETVLSIPSSGSSNFRIVTTGGQEITIDVDARDGFRWLRAFVKDPSNVTRAFHKTADGGFPADTPLTVALWFDGATASEDSASMLTVGGVDVPDADPSRNPAGTQFTFGSGRFMTIHDQAEAYAFGDTYFWWGRTGGVRPTDETAAFVRIDGGLAGVNGNGTRVGDPATAA